MSQAQPPDDALQFIRDCIARGAVRWTYHVTMRLQQRNLHAAMLIESAGTLEVIEEYPRDKYLPSYLLRGESRDSVFHVQLAADVDGGNIRVVTLYVPNPHEWDESSRVRRRR